MQGRLVLPLKAGTYSLRTPPPVPAFKGRFSPKKGVIHELYDGQDFVFNLTGCLVALLLIILTVL